ncbi:acyl-CoA dehydrogenase family protein [Neobacillus terrae]|uniref:acyl-CoA dehydrogenase family protein n=1 Tax=Neobacillus terrae TaxID=3034837 RepID=UPI00140BDDCA|nr:acyl-CoA dehydrogenase family protein [Neobacillus terrae]NHM29232.1 acyl-CoA/acyl-ACP dehydrogenase [Neobacillus terrae]
MISFKPTDDELAFSELARDFAFEHIRTASRQTEKDRYVSPVMINKLQDLGFMNMELPTSYRGLELPLISQVQILEDLSNGDLATIQGLPGLNEGASFIRSIPDNPILKEFKNSQATETWPTVSLLLNRNSRSKKNLTIKAEENGYLVNGLSVPVKMAERAECIIIAGEDEKGDDIVLWCPKQVWSIETGDYRLGLLASGCARFRFDNMIVSDENIIAKGGQAKMLINGSLSRIRVLEAAKEVGVMAAAVAYAAEYTSQRKAFGVEIAKFQGVSFTVAQMAIKTQAARNLVWRAAIKIDNLESDAIPSSLNALNFSHQAIRFVTDSAVQLLGGHGYVQDHPVEKWMRDAQAQVNLYETEGDLLYLSGEHILLGNERRDHDDILRAVTTSKSS